MAQRVKELASKPDNLSSGPSEPNLHKLSSDRHTCTRTLNHIIQKITKRKLGPGIATHIFNSRVRRSQKLS